MTQEAAIIRGAALRIRIGTQKELAERMGMKPNTIVKQLGNPESIGLVALREYVRAAHLTDDEIVQLVRCGM